MKRRLQSVRKRVRQVAWLVPLLVAAQQVGTGWVPAAEACSGSGSGAGWVHLAVADADILARVSIATDGFVLLHGTFVSTELEPRLQMPWVRATDEAGDDVPGKVQVLREEQRGEVTGAYLGWQSDQALTVGTVLQLSWAEADEGYGGAGNVPAQRNNIELEVVGAPASLPTPKVTLGAWLEVRHGVGELVDCEVASSCGLYTSKVPTREVRVPGVAVSWRPPAFSGMVAWEVRAETSPPEDRLDGPLGSSALVAGRRPNVVDVGTVTFAEDATDHCVVLVVKDLRTGEESRSEPICEAPGEPEYERADHSLGWCAEPPTLESLPVWCVDNGHDERCQGGDGAGGHASSGQAGEAATDEPIATRESPSGGCQFVPSTGGIGFLGATIALLSLISRRRRERGGNLSAVD